MNEARRVAVVGNGKGGFLVVQHGCATTEEAVRRGALFFVDHGKVWPDRESAILRAMRRDATLRALAGWKSEPSFCKS